MALTDFLKQEISSQEFQKAKLCPTDPYFQLADCIQQLVKEGEEITGVNIFLKTKNQQCLGDYMHLQNKIDLEILKKS